MGSLKESVEFWATSLQAPEFVSSIINEGHRLPFGQYTSTHFLKNNTSSLEHPQLVQQKLQSFSTPLNVKNVFVFSKINARGDYSLYSDDRDDRRIF